MLGADAELEGDRGSDGDAEPGSDGGAAGRGDERFAAVGADRGRGRKFIAGEPMNEATNLFSGRW